MHDAGRRRINLRISKTAGDRHTYTLITQKVKQSSQQFISGKSKFNDIITYIHEIYLSIYLSSVIFCKSPCILFLFYHFSLYIVFVKTSLTPYLYLYKHSFAPFLYLYKQSTTETTFPYIFNCSFRYFWFVSVFRYVPVNTVTGRYLHPDPVPEPRRCVTTIV